jgi:prepilin-type processing-associated H-X9-DG protein
LKSHAPRHAFTIVELLIAIGVIVALLGIILPAVGKARQHAWGTVCLSNLRQIGVMIQSYATGNSGEIPAVYGPYGDGGLHPMAWFSPGVYDHTRGVGGILLLVNSPIGMDRSGSLQNANLFICPSDDPTYGRRSEDFATATPGGQRRMSYLYCYVPPGGMSYRWWEYDPKTGKKFGSGASPTWEDTGLAKFERHNINQRNAASAAILYEPHVFHITGRPKNAWHCQGGNVLYLDGHVLNVPLHERQEQSVSSFENDPWVAVKEDLSVLDKEAGGT